MSDKITQKKRTQSVKGEDVIERLRSVLDQSKLSGRQFAEKIGLKAESATRLFNGVTGLTKPLAFAIELHFGVSAEWLLTGEGLRASDYRTLLDASEQALLECIDPSKQGKMRLGEFILEKLDQDVERQSTEYGRRLNKVSSVGKNMGAELSNYKKLRNRKEKLRSELWEVINKLRESDLKQVLVDPLLLAIHFEERWEEVRERSADYKQMQSFGLQHDFDDAYKTVKKITGKMKGLFKLTSEQRKTIA